ncbi:hypothetical protein B566_EDAN016889, partial [Ephemera danica]
MTVDTTMFKLVLLAVVLLQVANCNEISVNLQDFITLNGKFYYFSKTQMATMYEATKACNDADNLTTYGFHTSGVRVHHHWLWSSSGRLFGYHRWHPEMSCPTAEMQCCAYYFNGWIGEYNCDRTIRFICQGIGKMNRIVFFIGVILQIVSCVYINDKGEEFKIDSKELVIINGTRYYFMHILTATLYNAQLICKDDGLSLISLENQYESDAVYAYLQQENMDLVFWTSGVLVGDKWMWSSTGD